MRKISNFSPGPAKLPDIVLEKLTLNGIRDYNGTGISVLEMSHRSDEFKEILSTTEKLLRDLMNIPSNYEVLFLQGGGSGQFAAVPLNLMRLSKGEKPSADYAITGNWSKKAASEAEKYLIVHRALNPPLHTYTKIPDPAHWSLSPDAAYFYYCANETVHGVEFDFVPDIGRVPLVADISSNFLSKPIDVSKHGLLFAGTQKNAGKAGLTVVILRKDLIGHAHRMCPSIFDYKEQHHMGSIYNTPPVFSIFVTNLVLQWTRDEGGLDAMATRSRAKADMIYDVIENSDKFYHCPVESSCRSRMNVPFRIGKGKGDERLEKQFLESAEERGLIALKGHRAVGGIRASLYNAVSLEDTQRLADFMTEFLDEQVPRLVEQ